MRHFEEALSLSSPSITEKQRIYYEQMQQRFR